METLITLLDRHLDWCKTLACSYSLKRTYFDQAFGMLTMFCSIYPDQYTEAEKLWDEKYRPAFEAILWG